MGRTAQAAPPNGHLGQAAQGGGGGAYSYGAAQPSAAGMVSPPVAPSGAGAAAPKTAAVRCYERGRLLREAHISSDDLGVLLPRVKPR